MVNIALQSRNKSLDLKKDSEMNLNDLTKERLDYKNRLDVVRKTISDRQKKKSLISGKFIIL